MVEPLTSDGLDAVRTFLREQSTLALATVDGEGRPHAAPLYYVSDDRLKLYWLSSPESRHSVNLAARPHVAAAIYPAVWGWREIRGLQIEGMARRVDDLPHRQAVLDAYRRKFDLPASFDDQITASALYVLEPRWLRWLDNGVRFGFKAEFHV